MDLRFKDRGMLEIDGARICYRNLRGEKSQYNPKGERSFSLVIPNDRIADDLVNDVNEYGVGWNVRIKAPQEPGDEVFRHLPIKVAYKNGRGPAIYVQSGNSTPRRLDENTVGMLDNLDIRSVNLDIRPYDGEFAGRPFRSAYLQSMLVIQDEDRFAHMLRREEFPEE